MEVVVIVACNCWYVDNCGQIWLIQLWLWRRTNTDVVITNVAAIRVLNSGHNSDPWYCVWRGFNYSCVAFLTTSKTIIKLPKSQL